MGVTNITNQKVGPMW